VARTFEVPLPGEAPGPAGRVLYLLATYHLPEQVRRLVAALRAGSPAAPIVIHHDTTRSSLDTARLAQYPPVRRVRTTPAPRWADGSFVDAMLGSLQWIERRFDYAWIVVLSGQDYPLRPLAAIESELLSLHADAAIGVQDEVRDDPASRHWSRYFWAHRRLPRWTAPLLRSGGVSALLRRLNKSRPWIGLRFDPDGSPKLGRRLRRTPFGPSYRCYKGTLWGSYSRRAVRHLLETVRERPELLAHFRRTHAADEGFFPTLLVNDPGLEVLRTTRRYIDWRERGRHPRTLGLADLPRMLASGQDFARKLDITVDAALLDALDERLRR
jgi:hypothetical protein